MNGSARLVVYTTVYPGVEPFLPDFLQSVHKQTDLNFDLWIGVDTVEIDHVVHAMGLHPQVTTHWIRSPQGSSAAEVRMKAWEPLCAAAHAVVLVDSDDVLLPSRVEAARRIIQGFDFAGSALRLVDPALQPLGKTMGAPLDRPADSVLPRHNVFGLSNSVVRTNLLHALLPVPPAAEAVDWYLATVAWLVGARFAFDTAPRMDYRQHATNLTQVCGPYSLERVTWDTNRALRHFTLIRERIPTAARAERVEVLRRVQRDVEIFRDRVVLDPPALKRYVERLNELVLEPVWWTCVAHQSLRDMWQ